MDRRSLGSLALAVVILLAAGAADAQGQSTDDRGPMFSVGLSPIGWTSTPQSYLFAFDSYFHFNRNLSVGPVLQVGAKTGSTLVTFTVNTRYHMDVFSGTGLAKARPFLQGGIGLGHLGTTNFLFNTGFGVDYEMGEHLVLGSNMLFNVAPGAGGVGTAASGFVFSWQVLNVRWQF